MPISKSTNTKAAPWLRDDGRGACRRLQLQQSRLRHRPSPKPTSLPSLPTTRAGSTRGPGWRPYATQPPGLPADAPPPLPSSVTACHRSHSPAATHLHGEIAQAAEVDGKSEDAPPPAQVVEDLAVRAAEESGPRQRPVRARGESSQRGFTRGTRQRQAADAAVSRGNTHPASKPRRAVQIGGKLEDHVFYWPLWCPTCVLRPRVSPELCIRSATD